MSSVKDGVLDVEKFSSFDELINMLEKEVKERSKRKENKIYRTN